MRSLASFLIFVGLAGCGVEKPMNGLENLGIEYLTLEISGPDTTANYGPADSSFETTQRQASTNLVPRFSGSELALVAEAIPTDHYDSLQLRYDLKWRWRIWTLGKNRVSPQLMDLFRPESQDWSGPKEFFSATEETSWVSTIDTEKGYRVDVSLRDENGDEIAGLSPNFKVEGQKVAGVPVIRK